MFDIFVYGLLMPGECGYGELNLAVRSQRLGPDRVNGILYDLGDYPGLTIGGTGTVHGELLRSDDPTLLADLDGYELYDAENPAASEYLQNISAPESCCLAAANPPGPLFIRGLSKRILSSRQETGAPGKVPVPRSHISVSASYKQDA